MSQFGKTKSSIRNYSKVDNYYFDKCKKNHLVRSEAHVRATVRLNPYSGGQNILGVIFWGNQIVEKNPPNRSNLRTKFEILAKFEALYLWTSSVLQAAKGIK